MGIFSRQPLRAMPLSWRVFLANALILAAAAAVLAFSPATISSPLARTEALVLIAGMTVMLVLNLAFVRRAVSPLERLTHLMRQVDPLRPGERIPIYAQDHEVVALTESFNQMLDRLETERQQSGLRALAAQEAERRRIARELHDEIGQSLTGVVLQLERSARLLAPGEAGEHVREARETARSSLDDVRRIARELRPEVLDDLGLASALTALVSAVSERSDLTIEGRMSPDLPELSAEVELVLYRVAQESLTNVVRHARASKAELELRRVGSGVTLRVFDDGCGIDPSTAPSWNGIRGMRERAVLIGARLTISAGPAGGTEVRLEVPQPHPRR